MATIPPPTKTDFYSDLVPEPVLTKSTINVKHKDDVVMIRKVVNGWIIITSYTTNPYEAANVDTLVFNSIDDLCEGIKILYGEE